MLALMLVLQGLHVPASWAISISVAAWAWLMILLWSRQERG